MIQELFAGSNHLIAGERKISINSTSSSSSSSSILLPPPPPTPSSSTTSTVTTTTTTTNSSSENQQNLRCPRCDSSNTKFCYYNNYNLTQPRHFCKTCRRYWTKGGALRNVPIGGGCRKNKNVGGGVSSSSVAKAATTATKMKAVVASELGRSPLASGFDHDLHVQPSPILWGSPQNTHLLALLRASQNQNPNPNPSSMSIKEEGNLMGTTNQSHMVAEPLIANGLLNIPRTLGYDGGVVGQVPPSLGLCSSLWRNNSSDNNNHQDQQQQQNSGFVLGENHQSSGIQELYHKIRSTSSSVNNNYCNENSSSPIMFMGNMASSSSNSSSLSTILESSSVVGGGELGCWNPTLPWSDLPTTTTNGAYP